MRLQTTISRPRGSASLLICLSVVLLLVLTQSSSRVPNVALGPTHRRLGHPIEHLIAEKRALFDTIKAHQSTNLPDAITEYRRRYRREPPDGFDWWFALAQEHDFMLPDEFDTLMASMEPYHGISPALLRQRLQTANYTNAPHFSRLELYGGHGHFSDRSSTIRLRLLNDTWLAKIPYNMSVLFNFYDEPMITADHEEIAAALDAAQSGQLMGSYSTTGHIANVSFLESGHQPGWPAQAHACPYSSSARQLYCPDAPDDASLTFVSDPHAAGDVCANCALQSQHAMLLRPNSQFTSRGLVPIFSTAAPSHFNDLLWPSGYYNMVRDKYKPDRDPDWAFKGNKFYWTGSTYGGRPSVPDWHMMQRQRMVLKVRPDNPDLVPILHETEPGIYTQAHVAMSDLARDFFDARITKVVQCKDDEACKIQKQAFGIGNVTRVDGMETAYLHRFVIDVDGNGLSGRFYRLLRSKSVVIKQTILREWHDDRLIPWVHYIPLSTSFDELPELAHFLAGTTTGLALSERIALESTAWHNLALRHVDLELASIRMLLEYGRLISGDG